MRLAWIAILLVTAIGSTPGQAQSPQQETIQFTTDDDLQFSGTLYLPPGSERVPLLIVYHAASGGSVDFPFYAHLKTELPDAGIATLLFDRRGTADQPGDFETADFQDLALDGISALQAVIDHPRIDPSRIGAWGVSQGGWVSPLAANM